MKTIFFNKSNKGEKSVLIEMSKNEQKVINGGLRYIITRNPDGTWDYQLIP